MSKLSGGRSKEDPVFDKFKIQVESLGVKIDNIDETGFIYVSQRDLSIRINLDNVRKNYYRDKDETHIANLVNTILAYFKEIPSNWADARDAIYISLFPNDQDLKECIHQRITDEFCKGYIHREEEKETWISNDDLKKWNISEDELEKQAHKNADNLLASTAITFDTIEGRKLGLIEVEQTSLKGALLFAPAMKEKVKIDLGFPFYAVIPVRDFCYLFSEKDFDFFAERIGEVVVDEYKKSGYPITTEILKFGDDGIEAVGKYPTE